MLTDHLCYGLSPVKYRTRGSNSDPIYSRHWFSVIVWIDVKSLLKYDSRGLWWCLQLWSRKTWMERRKKVSFWNFAELLNSTCQGGVSLVLFNERETFTCRSLSSEALPHSKITLAIFRAQCNVDHHHLMNYTFGEPGSSFTTRVI